MIFRGFSETLAYGAKSRSVPRLVRACLTAFVMVGIAAVDAALADEKGEAKSIEVDQVIDPTATDVLRIFRFRPPLVRIPAGKTVRFLNSRGQHTVISIRKMWPKGVPEVNLSNISAADVTFNKAGLYGFTCRVHGRYGMVMLIAVGDEWPNMEAAKAGIPSGRPGIRMKQLLAELEKAR